MTESVVQYAPDALDRAIISHLRADGRASVTVLAAALGVSRGTVQARLDRLSNAGVLLGFTVRVRDDYDLGTVQAVMLIEVVGKSTAQVVRRLRGFHHIYELYSTNGKWDLVALIRAENLVEFDRLLREIRLIDGVSLSETSILLSNA